VLCYKSVGYGQKIRKAEISVTIIALEICMLFEAKNANIAVVTQSLKVQEFSSS